MKTLMMALTLLAPLAVAAQGPVPGDTLWQRGHAGLAWSILERSDYLMLVARELEGRQLAGWDTGAHSGIENAAFVPNLSNGRFLNLPLAAALLRATADSMYDLGWNVLDTERAYGGLANTQITWLSLYARGLRYEADRVDQEILYRREHDGQPNELANLNK